MCKGGAYLGGKMSSFLNFKRAPGAQYTEYGIFIYENFEKNSYWFFILICCKCIKNWYFISINSNIAYKSKMNNDILLK